MKNNKFFNVFFILILFACLQNSILFAKGWVEDGIDWYYQDDNGDNVIETIKTSGDKKYYLGEDGKMVRDFLLVDYNDATYYFNDDGEMVFNTWVAVDPYQVSVDIDSSSGLTVYLYYFGSNGKAYRAKDGILKKTIDGKKYLFNTDGVMLSGWIDENGTMWNDFDNDTDPFVNAIYYAGDETDGVLRNGWVGYTEGSLDDRYYEKEVIWFYFNNNNNKKVYNNTTKSYLSKNINGKQFAFDENGVMLTAWEADRATKYYIEEDDVYSNEHGSLNKKKWVYAVPSEEINMEDHTNDTSRWFYSDGMGYIYKNTLKRINTDYYVFDKNGIMRDGLVIISRNGRKYVDRIDVEGTNGKNFIVKREYVSGEVGNPTRVYNDKNDVLYYFNTDESNDKYGARQTGTVKLAFNDNDFLFYSDKNGSKEGNRKKKYYQCGMELEADKTIGYGLILDYIAENTTNWDRSDNLKLSYTDGTLNTGETNDYIVNYSMDNYTDTTGYPHLSVIMANRNMNKKSNAAIKDKEGNYWMIGENKSFIKVVSIPIKYENSTKKWYYKSDYIDSVTGRSKNGWLLCDVDIDASGQIVSTKRGEGNYEVVLNDLYAINFDWAK